MKTNQLQKHGEIYNIVKYDDEGLWSLSCPSEADKISKIIFESVNNNIIIDCTAGLGGNTISFSKYFKNVISIEINKDRYEMLKENIKNHKLKNITLFNDDCLRYLGFKCDAYFFDPPWGGPDYKYKESINITLGDYSLYDVIKIIRTYNNNLIFFKLPFNYNLNEFIEFNYKINNIRNYLLITIY